MKRSLQFIESVVCTEEDIQPSVLHTKTKKREICELRQVVMYLGWRFENSESTIGTYFNRDHATAHHAKSTISDLYDTNRMLRNKIDKWILILEADDACKVDFYTSHLRSLRRQANELISDLNKIAI